MSRSVSPIPTILVHGGAWSIPDSLVEVSVQGVKAAALQGYKTLMNGGSAVDTVETAVSVMEDDPNFDAGTGSMLNSAGEVEMDAVIMEGKHLQAGAVACVQNIANPVQLARLVMDKTDHTLLVGLGASSFAKEMGMTEISTDELVTQIAKDELERFQKFKNTIDVSFKPRFLGHDTVGAVALDGNSNMACATSTGGITAKRPGRVGDSPIIGSGAYADNEAGAVSTTGHGEGISKVCLAHHIMNLMHRGSTAQQAAEEGIHYMSRRVNSSGGAIVLDTRGNIGKHFSTLRMPWAAVQDGVLSYGIEPEDFHTEKLTDTTMSR